MPEQERPIPENETEQSLPPHVSSELITPPNIETTPSPTSSNERQTPTDQEKRAEDTKTIAEVRSEVAEISEAKPTPLLSEDLLGDFSDHERTPEGKIILTSEEMEEVQPLVAQKEKDFFFSLPSIVKGHPTAADYDSQSANFSTRTFLLKSSDGKKIFGVNNSPGSFFHREFDALLKGVTGMRMRKAPYWKWKEQFTKRSQVPVMDFDDSNTILMPYLDNINAVDAIRNNKEVADFGPCEWAKDIDLEKKYSLSQDITAELSSLHEKDITWAEPVLPNIIISKDQKVVFVDPENRYYGWVEPLEQKARDLRVLLYSLAGSFAAAEDVHDFTKLVDTSLSAYTDPRVIEKMQDLSQKNPGFLQSAELKGLCQIESEDQKKLLDAVRSYKIAPHD